MTVRKLQITITLSALALALVHIVWPSLTIDAITLSLIIVAIIPWLVPLFKSIELPGGLKVEFQDLVKTGIELGKKGLLSNKSTINNGPEYSFLLVAEEDPKLALAGLRIEIEKRLKNIADSENLTGDKTMGIRPLLHTLVYNNVLSSEEQSVISDLINLLNKAVHGVEVDHRAARWAIEIGPRILRGLDERLKGRNKKS